jgi:hypothetical protein
MLLAAPAMAATTEITVTKYCDNNYSAAADSETLDLAALQALSSVYSNGPVYMQGGTFDNATDVWTYTDDSMACFGEQSGTYVRNITDKVDGMNPGDEIKVAAPDGYGMYFNYTNVYSPAPCQGEMILSWQNETHTVPDYADGIRLFFYTPSDLNFTNADMRDSMAPWYWRIVKDKYNPSDLYPSAKGLSVKTVSDLKIYPPHRYDFNTTGDTTRYAYEGGVSSSPGLNEPNGTTVDTSKIADDDGIYEQTASVSDGEYAAQRFVFTLKESAANIEKLAVTWDGTSSHDNASADQGATTYIWKSGTGYQTLSGAITSGVSDYVVDGNVTVLVKQNAVQSSSGIPPAAKYSRLATDYVKLVVTHHNTNSKYTL